MSRRLRLFPLNAVLFPGAALNLHVFEARYKQMIAECLASGEGFGVALIAEGAEAGDPAVVPHAVGSIAEIVEVAPLPFGRYYVSTIGRGRFRIAAVVSREPYLTVEAEMLADEADEDDPVLLERVRGLFDEYRNLIVEFSGTEAENALPDDALSASFRIGEALQVNEALKQRFLELDTARARLQAECDFLETLLPQLRRLIARRRTERAGREAAGEHPAYRAEQERYFGRYFSLN